MNSSLFHYVLLALFCSGFHVSGQSNDPDDGFITEYIYETQLSSNVAYVTMTGQSPPAESPGLASTETLINYETSVPESSEANPPPVSHTPPPTTASPSSASVADSPGLASSASPSPEAQSSPSTVFSPELSRSSTTVAPIGSGISLQPTASSNATDGPPPVNQPSPSGEEAPNAASITKYGAGAFGYMAMVMAAALL